MTATDGIWLSVIERSYPPLKIQDKVWKREKGDRSSLPSEVWTSCTLSVRAMVQAVEVTAIHYVHKDAR